MTQEEKQGKIAEACGYERRPDGRWREKGHFGECGIPNYFGCLNAMHKAEEIIFPKFEVDWYHQLHAICGGSWRIALTATAEQRAEAFGLTLKLWNP